LAFAADKDAISGDYNNRGERAMSGGRKPGGDWIGASPPGATQAGLRHAWHTRSLRFQRLGDAAPRDLPAAPVSSSTITEAHISA